MQTHQTLFLALQPEQRKPPSLITLEHLGASACSTANLPAVAGTQFNVVNPGAYGDMAQCHCVSHLDIDAADTTGDNLLPNFQTCRAKNVGITIRTHLTRYSTTLFAMANQRDKSRAVGVILDAFDSSGDGVPCGAPKIDDTVQAFVTTTLVAHGDTTGGRAAAGFFRKTDG